MLWNYLLCMNFVRSVAKHGIVHGFIILLYIATMPFWEVFCHSRVDNYFVKWIGCRIRLGISHSCHALIFMPSCESIWLPPARMRLFVVNLKVLYSFHCFLSV